LKLFAADIQGNDKPNECRIKPLGFVGRENLLRAWILLLCLSMVFSPIPVFSAMLKDGNPPDSWESLVASCKNPEVVKRIEEMLTRQT
jgi:hypothetical protein